MSMQLLKRRFTVDEYHRMAEAGILSEDDRVELIDGEIVEMVPIEPARGLRGSPQQALLRTVGEARDRARPESYPPGQAL